MDFAILGLLLLAPMTIYRLKLAFAQSLSLFYSDSLGGLRQALIRLERRGWIQAEPEPVPSRRPRRLYRSTQAGAQAFHHWMLEGPLGKNLEQDALLKVHFLGHLPTNRERSHVLEGILREGRAALDRLRSLALELDRQTTPPAWAPHFFWQRQTLNYGLLAHETGLAWFQERLEQVRSLAAKET